MSTPESTLLDRFVAATGLARAATLVELAAKVHAIPYGRSPERTAGSVLDAGRGTCSTKHYLLAALIAEAQPDTNVEIVHRVYRLMPDDARRMFEEAAGAVPDEGLVDVHTYLRVRSGPSSVIVDVTFPEGPGWDGESSMPPACGPGDDVPAGADPEVTKAALVAEHCDPSVREPFIAALARAARPARRPHGA